MASHFYYSVTPGSQLGSITKAASTGGTDIELRVDDATTGNNKVQVLNFLEALKAYITTDNAPA